MGKFIKDVPRILALIVGGVGMGVAGSIYCFGVYSNAVKKHFNYTQSEVEVISAMSNFGISLGFPAGFMCERLGARWTSLAALLIAGLGFMLSWSTTLLEEFYHPKVWLQDIYFFISGFGAVFMYMACLTTNMNNFHPKHRGKVVGLMDASFSAGPALFALLYGEIFINGHDTDEQNQNLGGFYLMSAISFAVTGLLGIIFLHPISYDSVDFEENTIIGGDSLSSSNPSLQQMKEEPKQITGLKMIKRFDFHYIFWAYIFCAGLQLMFQNNIGTYLKSYRIEEYTTLFTTINPIAGVFSKFFAGFMSDMLVHRLPRASILLAFNVGQTIALVIAVFFSDNFVILLIILLVVGFANGALWCLTPTMISEFYGMQYFGRNWGSIMLGNAFGGLLIQQLFGWMYDSSIGIEGETDCYGLICFRWSFIMIATLSFCSVIFNLGLLQQKLDQSKQGHKIEHEMCCKPSTND
ncbi:hypothetical protein KUTeg_001935 [Tegillarca granosa]|uniref:Major facilitator superfamily (MFS) profile domain-containing protein n=1 Tax=Tegillarca granosa TaxID=220873 RepID=A0ABQ9FSW5_TEGGR|nr:hypothetical protein KUTeg_001935 [Tegillarca granosa]